MEVFRTIVKWLLLIVVIIVVWKYVVPWLEKETGGGKTSTATSGSSGASSCVASAERASAEFGGGLGRFVNPPYDVEAWSSFRTTVDSRLNVADEACGCANESCEKVRGALRDLRGLISELDNSIRGGTHIEADVIRRMEAIDLDIEKAGDLAKDGK